MSKHGKHYSESLAKVDKWAKAGIEAAKTASKPNPAMTDEQLEGLRKDLQSQAYVALGMAATLRKKNDEAIANYKQAAVRVDARARWFGRQEEVIHMAHVASVKIDTGMVLSDIQIETSGGSDPIKCHGHHKSDAVRMKALIEQYQSDYYRSRTVAPIT